MKNSILILFFVLTSLTPIAALSNCTKFVENSFQQESSIKCYVQSQGQWYTGYIYYVQTQYGVKPTRYDLQIPHSAGGQATRGHCLGSEKFIPLNPNNRFAVEYNFTHYIVVGGFRVYVISG